MVLFNSIYNRGISRKCLFQFHQIGAMQKKIIDAGNEFIHAMECMSVADKMVREDGLDVMLKNEVAE